MEKLRNLLLSNPPWPALLIALLIYALLLFGRINGFGLIDPLQPFLHALILFFGLWLMALFFAKTAPKSLVLVKNMLGASIFLCVLLYLSAMFVGSTTSRDSMTDLVGRNDVCYAAVRKGGVGSSWVDIVERRVHFLVFVRERSVAQYERESVVFMDGSNPGEIRIHLREMGKPDRIDVIPVD